MKRLIFGLTLLFLAASPAGCRREPAPVNVREFPLTGQIVSIKADRTEVTVKHDDVKGFMPAMTMAFTVKEPRLLDALQPGDLIKATLVITDEEGYLKGLQKIGAAPLAPRGASTTPAAEALKPGDPIPDAPFVDDDGRPRPLAAYRGQFVLMTFIYTRCPLPDYCPRMHKYLGRLQQSIKARPALGKQVRLLSVSFDPDFDTPVQLKATATSVGADPAVWRFVTAPRDVVESFGARLGLSVFREGPNGQTITHNLRTALVDRDGKLVRTYNGNDWSPDEVVRDLEGLVR